jgi:hypothetical protein
MTNAWYVMYRMNVCIDIPGDMMSVRRHAAPLPIRVRHKGHLLPIFSRNKMLMAMAGTSTTPASQEKAQN